MRPTTTGGHRPRSATGQAVSPPRPRHGVPLPTAAIQFPLVHPAVRAVCVGARSADEVRTNAAPLRAPVPDALWDDLRSDGLLRGVIVDAHHHLWDPAERDYPWMAGDALAPIRRRYGIDELREVTGNAGIDATVVVQAIGTVEETDSLLAAAAASDGLIAGVVGWLDLRAPSIADDIARLRDRGGAGLLVGIRHQVQDEPDPEWLLRDDVGRGLDAVAAAGLVFDLLVQAPRRDAAITALRRHPDLRVVVDHAAKPTIAAGETEPWLGQLGALAELPNTTCKLSGLTTEADWSGWSPADLAPYAAHVLDRFGADRVMAGSDWPVCLLAGSHADAWHATATLIDGLGTAERAAVLGGTAVREYRLAAVLR